MPEWLVRDPRVADPNVITADNRSCFSVGWKVTHHGLVRPAERFRTCTTTILSISFNFRPPSVLEKHETYDVIMLPF
jgi:hypothetical protein